MLRMDAVDCELRLYAAQKAGGRLGPGKPAGHGSITRTARLGERRDGYGDGTAGFERNVTSVRPAQASRACRMPCAPPSASPSAR